MTFLPSETIIIETSSSKEDTIFSLMENVGAERTFRFSGGARAFEGYIKGNEFEIKRTIDYSNSFLPILKGRIENSGSGTRLIINVRIRKINFILMPVLIVFVSLAVVDSFPEIINNRLLAAVGTFILSYVMMMGGYLFEIAQAKKILTEIVKGGIISGGTETLY